MLFETDEGDSQLVSRKQLKELIDATGAKLDFVFVASCHSEFVGRIFLEAGAKHVICIDQKNEVEDSAVITFTDAFYDAIFSNAMSICKAFLNARAIVNINHSPEQASIFKLLLFDVHLCDKPSRKVLSRKSSAFSKISIASLNRSTSRQRSASTSTERKEKVKHVCSKFGKFPKGLFKEMYENEP